MVLEQTAYRAEFDALNVLIDNCDSRSPTNYFIVPDEATGNDAFFEIDFGCTYSVVGVKLKNTHNWNHKDR
jgi:hypothetical protein